MTNLVASCTRRIDTVASGTFTDPMAVIAVGSGEIMASFAACEAVIFSNMATLFTS
jgi:hypothetical protein